MAGHHLGILKLTTERHIVEINFCHLPFLFFAAVLAGAVLIATSHVRRILELSFGTMRRAFAGCVLMPFPVVVVFASVEGLFEPPDGQRIIIIQI